MAPVQDMSKRIIPLKRVKLEEPSISEISKASINKSTREMTSESTRESTSEISSESTSEIISENASESVSASTSEGTATTPTNRQYYHHNGLLKLSPYYFDYCTWAKGRWIGRSLQDLFAREFRDRSPAYYRAACLSGLIRVNDEQVGPEYVVRPGDRIQHRIHRHEPPVLASPVPEIISVGEGFMVVNKPPSIPMHPSGQYRYLSLTELLLHRHSELFSESGHISCVNRLDRLVSGLVVISRSPEVADSLRQAMQEGQFQKLYLARVRGDFRKVEEKKWLKKSETEIVNFMIQEERNMNSKAGDTTSSIADSVEGSSNTLKEGTASASADTTDATDSDISPSPSPSSTTLSCNASLHIVEHKVGISTVACPSTFPSSKPSCTHFHFLHYDSVTDLSLLLVRPVTGRTHQIRIHLQYCGYPIHNDPLYGGVEWKTMPECEIGSKEWFEGAQRVAQSIRSHADSLEEEGEGDIEGCPDCLKPKEDPEPEALVMDLHALKYSGPIGSFQTPLPSWAKLDY